MDRLEAAKYIKDHCLGSEVYRDGTTWNDAMVTAVEALEGKDTNVPTNSALDHIHNVVRDESYKRGYEQAKAEYDHKLTEIKSRIKDHYYNKGYAEGYEQGKSDANHPEIPDSWIPVSEKLPKSNPEDLEYPTVIICLKDGTVELGCFYESTKEWGTGEDFDRLVNPVAWMPLPEAYEERVI